MELLNFLLQLTPNIYWEFRIFPCVSSTLPPSFIPGEVVSIQSCGPPHGGSVLPRDEPLPSLPYCCQSESAIRTT